MDIIKLKTGRDTYDKIDAARYSMTAEELIKILSEYPADAKVIFSNDNGYSYGYVNSFCVGEDFGVLDLTAEDKREIENSIDETIEKFIDAELLPHDFKISNIKLIINDIFKDAGVSKEDARVYAEKYIERMYD